MPDADWWAKVARDRPGGEGMTDETKPLTDEELTDIQTKARRFADAHEPALLLFARTCIDLVAEVRRLRRARAAEDDVREKMARAAKAAADFGEALRKMGVEP